MKILILYRHFWPDSPPYASMLRSIGARLTSDGHQVDLVAQQPCYKLADIGRSQPSYEILDGISVTRLSSLPGVGRTSILRLIDKLLWLPRVLLWAVWAKLKGKEYDVVWTASIPPVAQGMVGRWIAGIFGARFVYHCQDLYPETAIAALLWKRGSLWERTLRRIEKTSRNRADPLVTLSQDMARTVTALTQPRSMQLINNFLLEDFSGATPAASAEPLPDPKQAVRAEALDIIFAGNLGVFQGLDVLVDGWKALPATAGVKLTLMGEGKALEALRVLAGTVPSVHFERHLPYEQAKHRIAAADLGIVITKPGILEVAFPSKVLTYLGLGIPLLAIIDENSQLARMIEENDVGFVVPDASASGIAKAVTRIEKSPELIARMRERASNLYETELSRHARLDEWSRLFATWAGKF